jgi:hypothetical protein
MTVEVRAALSCLLVGFALMFAGTANAAAPSAACSKSDTHQIESGSPGPIICTTAGVKTVFVARRTMLVLSSMRVQVTGTRTTKTLVDQSDGVTFAHAKAQGTFAIVTLRITNETHQPQLFDEASQAELQIGVNQYSSSLNGEDADAGTQGLDDQIQPGESATGDIVFDVPTSAISGFTLHSALLLANFNQFLTISPTELGLIYLGT